MRRLLATTAVVLGLPGAAVATTPVTPRVYEGVTSQQLGVSFRVDSPSYVKVTRFAIRYRSTCSDGETLRSTFRFTPVKLSGVRFRSSGTVTGTLTDDRAYTSNVRLAGKLDRDEASGTFRLVTRIPDDRGGTARCATAAVNWNAEVDAG